MRNMIIEQPLSDFFFGPLPKRSQFYRKEKDMREGEGQFGRALSVVITGKDGP